MDTPQTPFDAATVILTRDRKDGQQYEIYLMRRSKQSNFMGGAYVFPGGRLDDEDCSSELNSHIGSVPGSSVLTASKAKEKLQETNLSEHRAMGLYFCAIRETFEESGVFLAYDSNNNIMNFTDNNAETEIRFAKYRSDIHDKKLNLCQLAQKENIKYAMDLLIPYSNWITPEIEKRRFNARFFLAKIPEGQIPAHDNLELSESLWITPDNALKQQKDGNILLMPPTLKTIVELNMHNKVVELFNAASKQKIFPILPQGFQLDNGFGVKLPHDPEYEIEGYKQPLNPNEPSRVIMEDGRWRIVYSAS